MPHAFQVLTRALHALCQHIISGSCYWYVDDLMAVSRATLYTNDSTIVDAKVQQLLGRGSIAAAKLQVDRCLEFLGWTFNLDTRTITLCERNMNKFVHALFSFNPTDKISISHIQRFGFVNVTNIDTLSAHATIHSYHACHHKRLHPTPCQNSSIGPGTIRYNDVACFCFVVDCSARKVVSHHGVLSTTIRPILHQV